MVNFGFSSATLLGIFLAVAGAGLYFMRTIRPEVSRDYDIFFSAVGLLAGLILIFQGWRLDPILQFLQLLLAGSAMFFAGEAIRLRGITTEQARRGSPIADDRRVSKTRVYTEAELDQIEPYEDEENYNTNKRRLRGYAEARPNRSAGYESEAPRPSRNRRPSSPPEREDLRPSRNRRPSPRPEVNDYTDWEEDVWEEPTPSRRPRRPRPEEDAPQTRERPERTPRTPRRPRPEVPAKPQYEDEAPAAYVDYQPLDDEDFPQETAPPPARRNDAESDDYRDQPSDYGDRVEDEGQSRFDY